MTQTDWTHLGILVTQYLPWLAPFAAAVAAWVTRLAPFVQDKRIQALAAQAVAAAEQTIGDTAQRYDYVDGLLHDTFPTLSPDERHAIIEGAVQALHLAIGTFESAQPPTPAQDAQTAKMQQEFAQLQADFAALQQAFQVQQTATAPRTAKLARTPAGQFAPKSSTAASIILPDKPLVAEAAHPDAS